MMKLFKNLTHKYFSFFVKFFVFVKNKKRRIPFIFSRKQENEHINMLLPLAVDLTFRRLFIFYAEIRFSTKYKPSR